MVVEGETGEKEKNLIDRWKLKTGKERRGTKAEGKMSLASLRQGKVTENKARHSTQLVYKTKDRQEALSREKKIMKEENRAVAGSKLPHGQN